jgi:hypothetical protein
VQINQRKAWFQGIEFSRRQSEEDAICDAGHFYRR